MSLVARAGEETVKTSQKNGRQVIATRRVEDGTPIIVVKKDEVTPKVEIVDDTKPAPQLLPASAPIIDLPEGPEPGDVLRVNTDFGVVHVLRAGRCV